MTISIIKKHITLSNLILCGLPILWLILVAFQSVPLPRIEQPIKTKTHKSFHLGTKLLILDKHTKTTYSIHGDIIQFAEYGEDSLGNPVLERLKIIKYNRQGLYIGTLVYNQNTVLVWSEENTYNDTEQITKTTQVDYNNQENTTYTLFFYDEFGNVNSTQTFDNNTNQISEQKRNYTATGELLSISDWLYVEQEGKLIKKTVNIDNQYNAHGQLIQSTMLLQEGKNKIKEVKLFKNNAIVNWITYENGQLVNQFKQQERDSLPPLRIPYELPPPIPLQTIQLEYDDAKRDPLEYIPHQEFRSISTKNNKHGLPTKKVVREYNQVVEVIVYTYDDTNQLIEELVQNKLTKENKQILYEYDAYNNPIQKTIYINEVLSQQHTYSYQYYRQ